MDELRENLVTSASAFNYANRIKYEHIETFSVVSIFQVKRMIGTQKVYKDLYNRHIKSNSPMTEFPRFRHHKQGLVCLKYPEGMKLLKYTFLQKRTKRTMG